MIRDDWEAVYQNQDKILNALKILEDDIFLAGGTGLHRFILPCAYRHSEDLDFFFPTLQKGSKVIKTGEKIETIIKTIPGASLEQSRWIREEETYRFWCSFEDNSELIKVELLNFTCTRLGETDFILAPFKTENPYNLLLYKLKALCDRPDTIKDLFDLYFLFRKFSSINIDKLINDLNIKFENAIGIRYKRKHIIKALNHQLRWDIELSDIKHSQDLILEVNLFQKRLQESFKKDKQLDFSDATRIKQNAKRHKLDIKSYIELIEILDENTFWIDDVIKKTLKPTK